MEDTKNSLFAYMFKKVFASQTKNKAFVRSCTEKIIELVGQFASREKDARLALEYKPHTGKKEGA